MRRKILLSTLALLLVVSLVATGCAAPAPAPAPVPGPAGPPGPPGAPAPAPAPVPVKPTVWRYQLYEAGMESPEVAAAYKFADEVFKQSDGRLKIEIFEAGVLGYTGFELGRIVARGMLEMASTMAAAIATDKPAFEADTLPLLFPVWSPEYDKIAPRLAVKEAKPIYDRMADELNLVWLPLFHYPDSLLATKRVATVEDWKGLKLRSWSKLITDAGESLGATITTLPYAEIYTAFATGVIDANVGEASGVLVYKFYEVAPYFNLWNFDASQEGVAINKQAWEGIDKDLQDLVIRLHADMSRECYDNIWSKEWDNREELRALGMEIVDISPEEKAKVRAIVEKGVWEPFMERAGPDAVELLNVFKKYGE